MLKKETISTNQIVWLLFVTITSFAVLRVPGLLIYHAGRDSWLSVLVAWLLDVSLAIVYAYMTLRFPGQNFVQYSITILGKYFGKIIGIIFPLFFIVVASLIMMGLIQLLSNFLPETPNIVILSVSYILIAFTVKKGIEVIARVNEIMGPIYLISLILLFVLVAPSIKFERVEPQLIDGIYPFLSGTFFILPYIAICILMSMYDPLCNKPQNGFLTKFIAVSIGCFIISILVVFAIGAFGVEVAGSLINPGYKLARLISIANFFERVEVLWFMISVGACLLTVMSLMWASSLGISQVFGLSTYKPIVYPVALLSMLLSLVSFDHDIDLINFAYYAFPILGAFVQTGLELVLFILAIILKKRG